MNWTQFFYDNFISGWSSREPYNWFDTMAYALLAIILIMVSYPLIKKRIKFSYKTALQIIPFIILGSFVRVFADNGVYPSFFWTVTPGVWIIFFLLIIISLILDSKFKLNGKLVITLPIIFTIPHLFYIGSIVNPTAILYFVFFYAISLVPFVLLSKRFKFFKNKFNFLCIAAHLFDATSSFINVDFFNYIEIHVVGGYFVTLLGTGAAMYLVKSLVLPILYYIDKEEETNWKNYLKMVVLALGFGPGIRNLITVILGV